MNHYSTRCLRGLAILSLLPALADCSETAGGPDYVQIGLGAGRTGAVVTLQCTWMPVMPGGIVERELELNGGIGAWLRGTRDGAHVKFSGIEDAGNAERTFSHDAIVSGFGERIDVVTGAGDDFVIIVSSGCGNVTL